MKRVKGKWASARRFIAFSIVAFFATSLALGQSQGIRFSVPYGFTAGSTSLPAGTYTFSISTDAFSKLKVQSDKGVSADVNIISRMNGPNQLFRGGSLVLEKTDGGFFLSEVWISGTDGALVHSIPNGNSRIVISGYMIDENRSYSGKAAFNLTCARCHGDNGMGNEEADKFFGLKIPLLTSAAVQGKSDAELRQLINQGSSAMPPVEIDESGYRHRLPPQDVDAVIAYLRTLQP
jgi:mono/diheme cytochrome c family protein